MNSYKINQKNTYFVILLKDKEMLTLQALNKLAFLYHNGLVNHLLHDLRIQRCQVYLSRNPIMCTYIQTQPTKEIRNEITLRQIIHNERLYFTYTRNIILYHNKYE